MIRVKLRQKPFQRKLILISVACAILAVLVCSIGLYQVSIASMNQLSHELQSNYVRQISLNIDDNIEQIKLLMIDIELNSDFEAVMEEASDTGDQNLILVRRLQQKLMQVQLLRRDINGIYVFDRYGNSYYSSLAPSLKNDYQFQEESWIEELNQQSGVYIQGSHIPARYVLEKYEVITLVQQLHNISNNQEIGTVMVDVKLDMFDNIMSTLGSSQCVVLIIDAEGQLVYSNDGVDLTGAISREIFQSLVKNPLLQNQNSGTLTLEAENRDLVVDFSTSEATGWKVVSYTDPSGITNITEKMETNTWLFVFLAGLVTAACTCLIIRKQFRVLNSLKEGMGKVMQGDYSTNIQSVSKDEIGEICDTFNAMTQRLNYLINTVDRLKWEKQEVLLEMTQAELDALQAQINPHFIYNTLEAIGMMAEINDDYETGKMATALGKLLRTSIKGKRLVTVEEELEYTRNYLMIQQLRFCDHFTVQWQIEPDTRLCLIPKLILQPLIENSIHHGLDLKQGTGTICISNRVEGENLIFTVCDDGIGMDPQTLDAVLAQLSTCHNTGEHDNRHIGLANVNQRIQLYFQSKAYGISVQSTQGQGTTITVTLPACWDDSTMESECDEFDQNDCPG